MSIRRFSRDHPLPELLTTLPGRRWLNVKRLDDHARSNGWRVLADACGWPGVNIVVREYHRGDEVVSVHWRMLGDRCVYLDEGLSEVEACARLSTAA